MFSLRNDTMQANAVSTDNTITHRISKAKGTACNSQYCTYFSHEYFGSFPASILWYFSFGSAEAHDCRGYVCDSIRWIGKRFQLSEVDFV